MPYGQYRGLFYCLTSLCDIKNKDTNFNVFEDFCPQFPDKG